ncbi:uncharacterized protein LOC127748692 isoform X3 [Frankliniella occidentalis]|uniref:Uncharacterized protein LOC127748692 isoform X3 n=1 Tax=Frankliniella occidentalis TaxID=133901 RepID=A0A9C6WWE4_FRAOC|nr:uncharacterized protein LOC127748692 isoform X3 [Frankliniella occidentalis]
MQEYKTRQYCALFYACLVIKPSYGRNPMNCKGLTVGDFKRRYVVLALLLGVVGLGVVVGFTVRYVTSVAYTRPGGDGSEALVPPNPEVPLPPSASVHHVFKRGAVCADGAPCSAIGK